jgi:hypothetical protein
MRSSAGSHTNRCTRAAMPDFGERSGGFGNRVVSKIREVVANKGREVKG